MTPKEVFAYITNNSTQAMGDISSKIVEKVKDHYKSDGFLVPDITIII